MKSCLGISVRRKISISNFRLDSYFFFLHVEQSKQWKYPAVYRNVYPSTCKAVCLSWAGSSTIIQLYIPFSLIMITAGANGVLTPCPALRCRRPRPWSLLHDSEARLNHTLSPTDRIVISSCCFNTETQGKPVHWSQTGFKTRRNKEKHWLNAHLILQILEFFWTLKHAYIRTYWYHFSSIFWTSMR